MAESASWMAQQRVPKAEWAVLGEIVQITDEFCGEHLDGEYADLCRDLAAELARKRPFPLRRGDRRIWAAGIVHTVGWVNFLADPAQRPHLRTEQLADLLGVKQTTMGNKGALIHDRLGIGRFDPEFSRREMIEKSPFAWLIEINGLPIDARWLPEKSQRALVETGILPFMSPGEGGGE
ncbi:DUF6398 domain-containing protein [Actinospica robiniae]|uniref:DUF6398 domain-containing protein n=1 Tax=Actinospica robiniae TaxID=304901 RepID=UPI0004005B1C|nr:DUF6398 domain-containing protein [Actinospica robiniae]